MDMLNPTSFCFSVITKVVSLVFEKVLSEVSDRNSKIKEIGGSVEINMPISHLYKASKSQA